MRTLIALMMTLLLSGCAAMAMVNVTNEAPPQPPEEQEEPAEEVIRYTVENQVWEEEAAAEDGTELASYRFDLPVLKAVREDGTALAEAETEQEQHALAVVSAFNEKFGKWAAAEEFPEFVDSAAEDLALRREVDSVWTPYVLELECAVYQTDQLISVSGTYYSDTGGAHPNTWMLGWNFSLEEGCFFGPELLANGTELQDAVTAEIIRQANTPREDGSIPAEGYWEDYESIAANWACYTVIFDEIGMDVVFSAYELAPYAAGRQEFHLSYEFLEPYLNDHGRSLLGLETPNP